MAPTLKLIAGGVLFITLWTSGLSQRYPCDCDPCVNGGVCSDVNETTYRCKCPPQFTGPRCETERDPCDCDPCVNGGTCVSDGHGNYVCKCPAGFTGRRCETKITDPCKPNPCLNGGTCHADGNHHYHCICSSKFTGRRCESEIDACASNPCKHGGTCQSTGPGSFICICPDDYTGTTCESEFDGYTCAPDNNPCKGPQYPGTCNFHFKDVDKTKFVQCNEWGTQCFEMPCAKMTVWDQSKCTCVRGFEETGYIRL